MELSAKTLWPLFPLLLLVVVVCLTWALVIVVRHRKVRTAPRAFGFGYPINYAKEQWAVWIQGGALVCYLLAAASAIASESGGISANVHRPFSLLTQVFILWGMYRTWGKGERALFSLNAVALGAILADTALHFLLVR